jgi:hypothetical protein
MPRRKATEAVDAVPGPLPGIPPAPPTQYDLPASVTNDSARSFRAGRRPVRGIPGAAPGTPRQSLPAAAMSSLQTPARGANDSHATVTSPCRHLPAPSRTGQCAEMSRTARIQRWRAP